MPRSFLVKKPERTRSQCPTAPTTETSIPLAHDDATTPPGGPPPPPAPPAATTSTARPGTDLLQIREHEKPTYCDPYCAVPGMCGPHRTVTGTAPPGGAPGTLGGVAVVGLTIEPGMAALAPYTPLLHPLALRLSQSYLHVQDLLPPYIYGSPTTPAAAINTDFRSPDRSSDRSRDASSTSPHAAPTISPNAPAPAASAPAASAPRASTPATSTSAVSVAPAFASAVSSVSAVSSPPPSSSSSLHDPSRGSALVNSTPHPPLPAPSLPLPLPAVEDSRVPHQVPRSAPLSGMKRSASPVSDATPAKRPYMSPPRVAVPTLPPGMLPSPPQAPPAHINVKHQPVPPSHLPPPPAPPSGLVHTALLQHTPPSSPEKSSTHSPTPIYYDPPPPLAMPPVLGLPNTPPTSPEKPRSPPPSVPLQLTARTAAAATTFTHSKDNIKSELLPHTTSSVSAPSQLCRPDVKPFYSSPHHQLRILKQEHVVEDKADEPMNLSTTSSIPQTMQVSDAEPPYKPTLTDLSNNTITTDISSSTTTSSRTPSCFSIARLTSDCHQQQQQYQQEQRNGHSDAQIIPSPRRSRSPSVCSSNDDSISVGSTSSRDKSAGRKKDQTFQDGVTVGYTYDAFFITDGRSRRRNPLTVPEKTRQRYTCSECGKHYATSSNLSRHKQTHRSLDSQLAKKCPHCNKVYVSMPALSMHILTHNLNHQCPVCNKAFSRPWLLQGHMRSHTGQKPYGCAHCGKAFADRSNLRAHMQTHSAFKHYTCQRCDKSFALKSYLNKHYESACFKDAAEVPRISSPASDCDVDVEGGDGSNAALPRSPAHTPPPLTTVGVQHHPRNTYTTLENAHRNTHHPPTPNTRPLITS